MSEIDKFARRSDINRNTTAELACRAAIVAIESLAADPRLTKAQCLIDEARSLVADYVDDTLAPTTTQRNGGE